MAQPLDWNEVVRKMAHLSKLELTADESRVFASQLGDVLKYIDQLAEADVGGVLPLTHPIELPTALREDVVHAAPLNAEGKPKVLDSAPETLNDGFRVPPIL
jgi:aspartyl-tRNA(Asn)/glutamyl-tRNA(Gln) amidotransferase subunit C